MVRPRPQTLEEIEQDKPDRVAVAQLWSGKDDDNETVWTYMELVKNRIFETGLTDTEAAYQEFVSSLDREKLLKSEKFEQKQMRQELDMMLVMRCTIIAYLDSLQDSEMTKIDPGSIENILTQNLHIFHVIMGVYFKTGLVLDILVNNPKRIYQKCVSQNCNSIRQAVAGLRKLDVEENDVYIEAMTIIRGE